MPPAPYAAHPKLSNAGWWSQNHATAANIQESSELSGVNDTIETEPPRNYANSGAQKPRTKANQGGDRQPTGTEYHTTQKAP